MSSQTVLDIKELVISIQVENGVLQAVRGVSFNVNANETVCLVGESGSGKSLTALSIMGLLTPKAKYKAELLAFNDNSLDKLSESVINQLRGRDISMIFQDPLTALNPTLSIDLQMIEGVIKHEKISKSKARQRAIALLERVGIANAAERLNQFPHQFSGGQRQRIMIAMALMCQPTLLIADEPTTALDVTIQAQVLGLLKDLAKEFKFALLLITHDFGVVSAMANRVCVMYAGRIVEQGKVDDVLSNPRHPYTQGLINSIPISGKTKPGTELPVIGGQVPEMIDDFKGCAFRWRCSKKRDLCNSTLPIQVMNTDHSYECTIEPNKESIE